MVKNNMSYGIFLGFENIIDFNFKDYKFYLNDKLYQITNTNFEL